MNDGIRTSEEIRKFSQEHAPLLAKKITKLCGTVIAKGMQGILEEVCRIQSERDELSAALKRIADWNEHTTEFAVDYGSNGVRDHYRQVARAALAAARGEKR